MSQWPRTEAEPAPGQPSLMESLTALIQMALTDGVYEVQRAAHETGIIRLNLSLTVRHGRPQGSASSLVFEKKTGY